MAGVFAGGARSARITDPQVQRADAGGAGKKEIKAIGGRMAAAMPPEKMSSALGFITEGTFFIFD